MGPDQIAAPVIALLLLLVVLAIDVSPVSVSSSTIANGPLLTCYTKSDVPQPVNLIDPHLCTHLLVIGNCTLFPNATISLPSDTSMRQYVKLKRANPSLKVILTLAPYNPTMSQLVLNETLMDGMIASVADYLVKNGLDGFDFDWEFPNWSVDARSTDRQGFSELLKRMRTVFDQRHLLIFVTVAGPYDISKVAYDIDSLNKYADYVQLMNYDFHAFSYEEPFTMLNAPLRAQPYELFLAGRMNSAYTAWYWLQHGFNASKLVFGIPTYARGYKLLFSFYHTLYAPAVGISSYGDSIPYWKVCNLVSKPGVSYVWNSPGATPYIHFGHQWIAFEDGRSVRAKAEYALAIQPNIAGVMIFALDSDDYKGECGGGGGAYPLIRAVKAVVEKAARRRQRERMRVWDWD